MSGDKITRDEMIEIFGEEMPIEAFNLLANADGSKTLGDLRAELRRIAAERRPAGMSEMVERVAQAIQKAEQESTCLLTVARAAIEEMRQITEAMSNAARDYVDYRDTKLLPIFPDQLWERMLDAALGKPILPPGFVGTPEQAEQILAKQSASGSKIG